jgi:hypothetical protein
VKSLSVDGGGWRMPSIEELQDLHEKDKYDSGNPSIDRIFSLLSRMVWSGKKSAHSGAPAAWCFAFDLEDYGHEYKWSWPRSKNVSVFAVRAKRK